MPFGDRNFNRISDNLNKMINQNATEQEVDQYVAMEGVTADEIKAFNLKKQAPLKAGKKIEAFGERALTGATLGLGGLISPAIGAAIGEFGEKFLGLPEQTFKERFKEQRTEFKERQRKLQEAHPTLSAVTEIAGGLVTGAPVLKGLQTVGRVGAKAVVPKLATALAKKGALPAVGRATATGAGFGGAFGTGTGLTEAVAGEKPITEVPKRALQSALLGGVAGGVLSGAGQAVGGLIGKPLARQFGARRAIKSLEERVSRRQLQKSITEQKPLLDIGDEKVVDIARRASAVSDNGKRQIVDRAVKQLEGQKLRVTDKIDDILGETSGLQKVDDVIAKYKDTAIPLYDKAMARGDLSVSNKVSELVKNKRISNFISSARKSKLGKALGLEDLPDTDINVLDTTKKYLDDQIGLARRQGENETVRALNQIKKEIVNAVDEFVPDYKLARSAGADRFSFEQAYDDGFKALAPKARPELLSKEFTELSRPQQDAFLLGIKDKIINELEKQPRPDVAERVFKPQIMRNLKVILGKENSSKFETFINDEIRKGRTFKEVMSIGKKATEREILDPQRLRQIGDVALKAYDALTGRFVERKRADIAKMLVDPQFLAQQLKRIPIKQRGALTKILLQGQPARSVGQILGTRLGEE